MKLYFHTCVFKFSRKVISLILQQRLSLEMHPYHIISNEKRLGENKIWFKSWNGMEKNGKDNIQVVPSAWDVLVQERILLSQRMVLRGSKFFSERVSSQISGIKWKKLILPLQSILSTPFQDLNFAMKNYLSDSWKLPIQFLLQMQEHDWYYLLSLMEVESTTVSFPINQVKS